MMHFGNMSGWGMGLWWIGGLIIIGLFIWFFATVPGKSSTDHHIQHETPMDILKNRYARGEINKEEFDRLSKDLHN